MGQGIVSSRKDSEFHFRVKGICISNVKIGQIIAKLRRNIIPSFIYIYESTHDSSILGLLSSKFPLEEVPLVCVRAILFNTQPRFSILLMTDT